MESAAGGTINFADGIHLIELTTGELVINKNLMINGPGAKVLTVRRSRAAGTARFRVLNIPTSSARVAITGVRFGNGSLAGDGGGIFNDGTLTLTECMVSYNTVSFNAAQRRRCLPSRCCH